MNNHILTDAVSCLDEELISEHLEMKEKLKGSTKRKGKKNFTGLVAAAACLVVVLACIPLATNILPLFSDRTIGVYYSTDSSYDGIMRRGKPISKDESNAFFAEHEREILSLISNVKNVALDSLRISHNGIYHVTVTEEERFVNFGSATFFVLDESGKIVASVDLFRANGSLFHRVDCGGTKIDKLNELLSQNPDTSFVMVYINFKEAAIAPDNTIYFLDEDRIITSGASYYSLFNIISNQLSYELLEQEQ